MATLDDARPYAPAPKPYVAPVVAPGHTPATVTDKISSVVLQRTPKWWYAAFAVSFFLLMIFMMAVTKLFLTGVGIWGINQPVGWGFDIINFVWWIGIGHAGTLISAILLLLRQEWRTSINRFAEAMTLFAVACAGMYPVLHTGRPWLAYWLLPYPNTMGLWPQFRSPLIWDVFAVSTYATVSLLFWYVGLVPDLATLRDRATHKLAKLAYGIPALGWRGSAKHWHNYEIAYLLLAGLSTPLVLSVHTVVSFDFSIGIIPGWHATIFPPYFVAGAVYAGFAMVLTLALPLRAAFGLHDFITQRHLQNMAKVMLATGLIVVYGYAMELFFAWYSGNHYEAFMAMNRVLGPYRYHWYTLILCNAIVPQMLWIRKVRNSPLWLFFVSMFINVGMWLERFIIIPVSLHRDFLPSSWGMYHGTIWDWATFIGTIGLFLSLLFLFVRLLPMISIFEMRTLVPDAVKGGANAGGSSTEVPR
jgi:molybdopterin-containing oxidoreductase family membrane subunit